MKFIKILETAAKTFAGAKLGGKRSDPKLAELDRDVLTVGLLVAALDGTILPDEYAAFRTLARKCRGGTAKNVRALLDAALPAAGQLMAMAQVGVYSEKERLAAFLSAAAKALPSGFAIGSMADLRRAFALWVTVGVADGEFTAAEKAALTALEWHYAVARAQKATKGDAGSFRLLEPDFLKKAEKIARDLAVPSKRAKAELLLEELIASVPTVDDKGEMVIRPAHGIAVKLTMMTMIGLAAAGSSEAARRPANCRGDCCCMALADGSVVHVVEEPRLVPSVSSKTETGWTNCCWCGCRIKYIRTFKWDPYERKWIETTEYVPELCKKCQHKADRENGR